VNATLDLRMHVRHVRTFDEWRDAARPLLLSGICAAEIEWRCGPPASDEASKSDVGAELRLPRALVSLIEAVAHFRDAGRWELMYRLAWRTLHENRRLLEDQADLDVRRAQTMERAVNRECHKMHAFVRFREVEREGAAKAYFAWFEPEHEILRRAVPFFTRRFTNMDWTIATPDGAAVWERNALRFLDAPPLAERPKQDALESLWRTYYRSICNVSRISPGAMQREMPQRYWRNLPETSEISRLVRDGAELFDKRHSEADEAALSMARAVQDALAKIPSAGEGAAACRRCELWRHATQAVSGEGPSSARIMLVGEQPGDEEDLRGKPFVGPAGRVLDLALDAVGLIRGKLYITNAVKHFKWEPRGKRRLHKRPDAREISACNVWLQREIDSVRPRVIVALGASAMRALTGATASVESSRGAAIPHPSGAGIVCTYHPSAILRADPGEAPRLRQSFTDDLRRAAELIGAGGKNHAF
jgi:DNA polymerase